MYCSIFVKGYYELEENFSFKAFFFLFSSLSEKMKKKS